jgi:tetratricopeptide (TPR) repeat protein
MIKGQFCMGAILNRRSGISRSLAAVMATLIAISGLTGCAGWLPFKSAMSRNKADDVGPARKDRKDEIARDFDKKRDDTQFDAAASSWERGDPESCEATLKQLLERNPGYRRAHLLLADLYLFNNQNDQAINELTKAVALDEKDAAAQHSLGQALDAAGLRSEAITHYQTATQLQPMNELFAISFKTALGVMPSSTIDAPPPIEALAAGTNQPGDPDRFNKQIGVPIEESHRTMSPMVAKMAALAPSNRVTSNRMSKGPAEQPVAKAAATASDNQSFEVAQTNAGGQADVSDGPANAFRSPQLAMANAGGALPTQSIAASNAENPSNDYSWRVAGQVRDPKAPRQFQTPMSDLDAWIRPVHFERGAKGDDASPEQSVQQAQANVPSQLPVEAIATVADAPAPRSMPVERNKPALSTRPVAPVVQAAAMPQPVTGTVDPGKPLAKAVEWLSAGDTAAAIDAASRGLSSTPEDAAALYRVLGAAHYRQGEFEAAQAALAQALSLDKTDALAYFLMGSTLAKLNQPAAAAKQFSEAARLDARFAR